MYSLPAAALLMLATLLPPATAAPTSANATSNTTPLTTLTSTTISSTGSVTIPGTLITTSSGSVVIAVPTSTTILLPDPTAAPKVKGEYKLRSQVVGSKEHRFDGLYLAAWSTEADIAADVVLVREHKEAARLYLNGTLEQADFGDAGQQWSMNINYDYINARWFPVSIRSPYASGFGTFYINGTGLQWTPNETPPPHDAGIVSEQDAYFGGWMACDWWHQVPQLFWRDGFFNDTATPAGCADVVLVQEYFH